MDARAGGPYVEVRRDDRSAGVCVTWEVHRQMLVSDPAAPGLQLSSGLIEGDFNYPQAWGYLPTILDHFPGTAAENAPPGTDPARLFTGINFLMGGLDDGPLVLLGSSAPGPGGLVPTHYHRTDTFRMTVGSEKQQMKDAGDWLGEGDFLVLGANAVYTQTLSTHGFRDLVIEADRRGSASLETRRDPDEIIDELEAGQAERFAHTWRCHRHDQDAISGVAATFATPMGKRQRILGSMRRDRDWDVLADGSRVAAIFLADPDCGPVVILSHNTPGAVESPSARYGSDRFRLILHGSCTVAGKTYTQGQFRLSQAGTVDGPVTHGPDGSSQLLLLTDRRTWLPDDSAATGASPRLAELDTILTRQPRHLQPS